MPDLPRHDRCDCGTFPKERYMVIVEANATCDARKFTEYVFNKNNPNNNGKYELFSRWGYDISDSNYLANKICELAKNEYLKGNYEIKRCSPYGPDLKITIDLNGRSFGTGWRLLPKGCIKNNTPYADDK